MAMVVRDAWSPRHDPVRTDGHPEDADDPGGGVLDAPLTDAPPQTWRRSATSPSLSR